MRVVTLVQAQLWEFKRNYLLLMGPLMMLFMNLLWLLVAKDEPTGVFPPMVLSLTSYMVGLQILVMAMGEEKDKRTLEALLLTPTRPIEVISAKLILAGGIAIITAVACLAMWGMPARPFVMALGFGLALLFAMSCGLLIGTMVPDAKSAGMITPLWIVLFFTGFPLFEQAMPKVWAVFAYLPSRPVISILQVGWTGRGEVALRDILIMLGYSAVMIYICARQMRRQAFVR